MNLLFPFSVTGGTIASVMLFQNAFSAVEPAEAAGFLLLAALASLAVLEHWLLMLPLPVEKLFRWSQPNRRNAAKSRNSISQCFEYTALKSNLTP
jgi:putative photosynthetic complex assembly protein 2